MGCGTIAGGVGVSFPEIAVADIGHMGASVAMTDGELQFGNTVASVAVGSIVVIRSRQQILGTVPSDTIAHVLHRYAMCGLVDRQMQVGCTVASVAIF